MMVLVVASFLVNLWCARTDLRRHGLMVVALWRDVVVSYWCFGDMEASWTRVGGVSVLCLRGAGVVKVGVGTNLG